MSFRANLDWIVVYCKNKEFVKVNTKKCCNPQECFQKIIDLGTPAMTFETFAKLANIMFTYTNYFDISLQHGQDYYQIKSIIPDVVNKRASKT